MIVDLFQLAGSLSTTPQPQTPLGASAVATLPINEQLYLKHKSLDTLDLEADSVTPLPFGGVTNAHVLHLRAVGGPVRVRLTSSDGTTQALTADPLITVISSSVPFTAIDLTRSAGVDTSVSYFLGEQTS